MAKSTPNGSRAKVLGILTALVLQAGITLPAFAADVHHFDIKTTDAATAIHEFGNQSGVQILASAEVLNGKQLNRLFGDLSTDDGFQKLLAGTGLSHRYVGDRAVALVTESPAANSEPSARTPTAPPATNMPATADANAPKKTGWFDRFRLAFADENTPAKSSDQKSTVSDDTVELGEIVVYARNPQQTLVQGAIPRTVDGALPFKVITHEEIERSGVGSAPELLNRFTQNSAGIPSAVSPTSTSNRGVSDGTINIRGLGAGRTLTLINDRRVGLFDSAPANSLALPFNAVERVEVLTGAGSAIYGASALGGVVNYILRTDFDGFEASASFGDSTDIDVLEQKYSVLLGKSFLDRRLNLMLSAEWSDSRGDVYADLGYAQDRIERILAIDPASILNGPPLPDVPGNIRTTNGAALGVPGSSSPIASVPAGYDGVNRGPSSYTSTVGGYNLLRTHGSGFGAATQDTWVAAEIKGRQVFAQVTYAVTPTLALFAEGFYVLHEAPFRQETFRTILATVPATNPYNPFGQSVNVAFVPLDLELEVSAESDTRRYVAGIKGVFGETWKWSLDATYFDEARPFTERLFDAALLRTALASSNATTAYNPFADLTSQRPNAASILTPLALTLDSSLDIEQTTYSARAAGSLFATPAGDVKISIGAEARSQKSTQRIVTTRSTGVSTLIFNPTDRDIRAAYAETVIPLVSSAQGWRFLREVQLVAAARYEDYTDSISSVNPAAAILIRPVEKLAFRGSVGTGFYPPDNFAITPDPRGPLPLPLNTFRDPLRNNAFLPANAQQLFGGNPELREEEADSYSFGLLYGAREVEGLRFIVDYYRIKRSDAIIFPSFLDVLNNEAQFPGRVVRGPPLPGEPPGVPGPIQLIDTTAFNAATQETDGWDYEVGYRFPGTSLGEFDISVIGTYIDSFKQQSSPSQPEREIVNTPFAGGPLRFRSNLNLGWRKGSWGADVTGRHVGSYTSQVPQFEGPEIGSSTEWDVAFNYRAADTTSWLAGTTVTLGARNVLDRRPPFAVAQGFSLFNDPRQRFVHLRLTKQF